MQTQKQPQELTLMEALHILSGKASRILALALAAAAAAGLITRLFIPPKYSSHITMYVYSSQQTDSPGTITSSDLQAAEGLLETCNQILLSNTVLSSVCGIVDEDYPIEVDELAKMVTAEVLDDTLMLRLTVTTTEAARSKAIANAFSQVVPEQITGFIRAGGVEIVDHARMPREADEPLVLKHMLLAFFGFGLLAAAVYLLVDVYDTTIRTTEALESWEVVPFLGAVPGRLEPSHPDAVNFPGMRMTAESPDALKNAYARIRTNILMDCGENCQILLITGPQPGNQKSVTASNLAASFGFMGRKTLLVDCDLRKGSLSRLWRLREQPGFSQLLAGRKEVPFHQADGFSVLCAGEAVKNPSELLASPALSDVLGALQNHYDCIILDAPGLGDVPDALILAQHADGVVLCVPSGMIRPETLNKAASKLERTGARVLGTILSGEGDLSRRSGRFTKASPRMGTAAEK